MDLKYIVRMMSKILILMCIVISCTEKDIYTGTWISTDHNLYIGTEIQISKNQKVIISNLPQDSLIISNDEFQDPFDSDTKEGFLDKKDRKIKFQNFSREETSYITFVTASEMYIVFYNGTSAYLKKK